MLWSGWASRLAYEPRSRELLQHRLRDHLAVRVHYPQRVREGLRERTGRMAQPQRAYLGLHLAGCDDHTGEASRFFRNQLLSTKLTLSEFLPLRL